MNDPTIQEVSEGRPLFNADQFVRESPVWRQMQYDALKANLRQAANAEGFEIVSIEQINSSVVRLAAYVGNRDWTLRHAVPLETILRQCLRRQWIELLRFQQVEPHPVYELFLRLGRSSPATKSGVEMAVRQAFAAAGRSVKAKFVHALIRGDRARVTVLVDSWLTGRNRVNKCRPKPLLIGRR